MVRADPPIVRSSRHRAQRDESKIASQERLKRELLTFFGELARRQPLVLFLDDLHWADESTIDILSYVATRCSLQRILIVGAYRPSDVPTTDHLRGVNYLRRCGRSNCRRAAVCLVAASEAISRSISTSTH